MPSKYVKVVDRDELAPLLEAGLLYWSFHNAYFQRWGADQGPGPPPTGQRADGMGMQREHADNVDDLLIMWDGRDNWDSYKLVED